jgi:hypothetical protein
MSPYYRYSPMFNRPPTDRKLLQCIYRKYVTQYPQRGDPYLPIDIPAVAAELGCAEEPSPRVTLYKMRRRKPTSTSKTNKAKERLSSYRTCEKSDRKVFREQKRHSFAGCTASSRANDVA